MISQSCNIKEFVSTVAHKGFQDILLTTEQEIIEVERHIYKTRSKGDAEDCGEHSYAESLKELIYYLKCSIRPRRSSSPDFPLFEQILYNVEKRNRFRSMLLRSK